MSGEQTRSRILDAAVELFNERGTGAVSTNHVAQAVGISPGNLYYHYRNKEEIIREILKRMFVAWGELWVVPQDHTPTLGDVRLLLRKNFSLLWEYRFFYRELVVLVRRDPELGRMYGGMQRDRLGEQELFLRSFVEAGVMREPESSQTLPALVRAGWIISTSWLSFLEAGEEPVSLEQMERGVEVIFEILRPHLTEEALREFGGTAEKNERSI
ncbi:MAG: TetR/AcrR family transcriptional regulator [Rubrobacteraceae bacterium]